VNHLDDDMLHAVAAGDIDQGTLRDALDHIRSCEECQRKLRPVAAIQRSLLESAQRDPCPSDELLLAFSIGSLKQGEQHRIEQHTRDCVRCQVHVQLLTPEENASLFHRQEAELLTAMVRERARSASSELFDRLLPKHRSLFEAIWSRVWDAISELRSDASFDWAAPSRHLRVAGALSFSGQPTPEVAAGSTIIATTVLTTWAAADGQISKTVKALRKHVDDAAVQLGAGRQLRERLGELLPQVLAEE